MPQDCRALYHPNKTCNQYAKFKFLYCLRVSVKIHIVGALIPEIIRNFNNLRKDFRKTTQKILWHFTRSVLWLCVIASMPPVLLCRLRHYTGGINYLSNYIVYVVASGVCWSIENMHKHTQYVGFLIPRIVSIVYSYFINRGWIKDIPGVSTIMLMLSTALVGLAASRNHFRKQIQDKQADTVDTKVYYDSLFSRIW